MRIAVLHNHPIHYKHLLFSAMAEQGADLEVLFAARSSNLRMESLQPVGASYRSHFLYDGTFESLPQIRTAVRAVRVVSRWRPDVVIISGYSYLPTWTILAWAKLRGTPVALWFESNFFDHPRQFMKEFVKRVFVGWCDVGHVYGQSNRRYLEFLGMNPSAIIEKRATVDWVTFSKRRAEFHSGFRRFVYVGRFSPEKNLPRLLQAFHSVRNENSAELVLVGYGPDEPLLRKIADDLGLNKSVVFAGPKTQNEVSMIMAESDCLVLPSLSEPWGLVANEALSSGIPVILSDRCGSALELASGGTGWIFRSDNTAELAEKIREVCGLSLERLREMGAASVKKASEYAPQECAKRILANLDELAKAHRAKRG